MNNISAGFGARGGGNWSNSVSYGINSLVRHNNNLYWTTRRTNAGEEPGVSAKFSLIPGLSGSTALSTQGFDIIETYQSDTAVPAGTFVDFARGTDKLLTRATTPAGTLFKPKGITLDDISADGVGRVLLRGETTIGNVTFMQGDRVYMDSTGMLTTELAARLFPIGTIITAPNRIYFNPQATASQTMQEQARPPETNFFNGRINTRQIATGATNTSFTTINNTQYETRRLYNSFTFEQLEPHAITTITREQLEENNLNVFIYPTNINVIRTNENNPIMFSGGQDSRRILAGYTFKIAVSVVMEGVSLDFSFRSNFSVISINTNDPNFPNVIQLGEESRGEDRLNEDTFGRSFPFIPQFISSIERFNFLNQYATQNVAIPDRFIIINSVYLRMDLLTASNISVEYDYDLFIQLVPRT